MPSDSATALSACQPHPFPDPIPGILPAGGVSLLAGASGVGKTALLATFLRTVCQAQPLLGHTPSPIPRIGYINADRGWEGGAGFWLRRAGVDIPPVDRMGLSLEGALSVYSMADDDGFDPRRLRKKWARTEVLAEFIDKLKLPPGSLVIVDPIALFLGGNLLDYDACAVACHELRKILRDRKLTIWATAHSTKLKADKKERYLRLQDQLLGSTAILGYSDTQMYLAGPQETGKPYFMFLWHSHIAKEETFQLAQNELGVFGPYEEGLQPDPEPTAPAVLLLFPDANTLITFSALKQLAAVRLVMSVSTLKRYLRELEAAGLIERTGHGEYRRRPVS